MAGATLALRDVHLPTAPGWWLLAALVCAVLLALAVLRARRARRRRAVEALFDDAVKAAATPAAQVAAMSELLRRAARLTDPAADRAQGDAWLAVLDGDDASKPFSQGPAGIVLDGGFRASVAPDEVEALRELARRRFLQWMLPR